MAQCHPGDKLILWTTDDQFTDAYIRHSIGLSGLKL